ncbi:TPA: hypothetical protein DIV55_05765 [Patescibacteria group bacterium]|uniref:DUF5615 domain-containing protein n=1 Tax=Candidatus Gottesmanbacteria bacterium GW2011_GWA1_43_11 TaxID=1618436 RepID=A0A0G1CJE8_9BACT|nr:MAG: hypothetical protein UV59_C0006G0053 [Candidatus Gottesmanbacteria bacterium GW2011_GWA1_43_11]HCS79214.1 hypothetical protein [Patescibacteria group bacterium]
MSSKPRHRKLFRHKLLLDEGFPVRSYFPRLNARYDLEHIKEDLHLSGISDHNVYEIATKEGRLVVTFNEKDFAELIKNKVAGVIAVSATLTNDQIEKKILALLSRSSAKELFGKLTSISGETRS